MVFRGDPVLIVDVETGQNQPWHQHKVTTYMHALPRALPEHRSADFSGEVMYDDRIELVPQAGIYQGFVRNLGSLIRRIAAPEAPFQVPSGQEVPFLRHHAERLPRPRQAHLPPLRTSQRPFSSQLTPTPPITDSVRLC